MHNKAYEGEYQGEKAVWLQSGNFEAAVLPEIGANLIAYRETASGYKMIREPRPAEMDTFKRNPAVFGIPVLFPPNRYEDGLITVNGCQYVFPVNEEATGNHLHGFFFNRPWTNVQYGTDERESFVELSERVDIHHEVYQYFPHHFEISLRYALSADNGLTQRVKVTNLGNVLMPCLLGLHTSVNAPFAPESSKADCSFTVTIGNRWELNERMLPTGAVQQLDENEEKMKNEGVSPFFAAMNNHYSAEPQNGTNRMVLTDNREKVKLIYDAGTKYKHWMIWNNNLSGSFFCPEPQINMVNAPNLKLPAETTGLFMIAPGEAWSETSRLYLEKA